MLKYDYTDETKQYLNNIEESSSVQLKVMKDVFTVQYNNISTLFNIVENLQRENSLLKQILKEIINTENFNSIKENKEYKNFLRLD